MVNGGKEDQEEYVLFLVLLLYIKSMLVFIEKGQHHPLLF
jgi:hypothetical protein